MSDTTGTSEAVSTEATDSGPVESQATSANSEAEASQGNPAWQTYRDKLGTSFKFIENDLAEDDRRAQTRISEANAKAKQYEDLGTIEDLKAARQLAQQVGESPLEVYNRLGEWLRQNGQIKEAEAVEAAAEELENADEEDEAEETPEDPRLQWLLEQEQQRAIEKADSQFKAQMKDIRSKNDWMSEDDENEILQRALDTAQRSGKDVDLAAAAESLIGLRTRYLQTPRPGASAPQLVPSGGGAPARSSNFDFKTASKEDRLKYAAEYLDSQKGN